MNPLREMVKGEQPRARITEGDGSHASPFVIHTSNLMLSAAIQAEIIDSIYGHGTYQENGQRNYFHSARGEPGNRDLCEHVVVVGGKKTSVWFDLYLVSRLVNDPGLQKTKRDMLAKIGIATMPEGKENRGSGVSIDNPYRLAATHPLLGVASQKMLISHIYGEQGKDWFDNGRVYHPNHICEQTIRLPSGQIHKVFFDESALDYNLPIPEDLRPALEQAAANMRVPNTQLVSRFPLIEVKARTAAEAGKIIVTHLKKAEEQGWVRGIGYPFVDGWRNDYELTRGDEKTIMSFDMRPALIADSKLNLIMFSALESLEAVDTLAGRMEAMKNPSPNVIELDFKRLLLASSRLAGIAAAVTAIAGFFLFHSLSGALGLALVGFVLVLAWCYNAFPEQAAARGLEVRVLRGGKYDAAASARFKRAAEKRAQAQAALDTVVQPDAILAAVVGPESRKRSELTKTIWSYISQHGLQDKNNPKLIHADQKLLHVFDGKKSVTMFELVKFVSKHLK